MVILGAAEEMLGIASYQSLGAWPYVNYSNQGCILVQRVRITLNGLYCFIITRLVPASLRTASKTHRNSGTALSIHSLLVVMRKNKGRNKISVRHKRSVKYIRRRILYKNIIDSKTYTNIANNSNYLSPIFFLEGWRAGIDWSLPFRLSRRYAYTSYISNKGIYIPIFLRAKIRKTIWKIVNKSASL